MSVALAVLSLAVLAGVVLVRRRRSRVATVFIAAEPEAALLSSAAALRRLGARITRYDSVRGTLEARAPAAGTVRLRATAHDGATTRVDLKGDGGRTIRGFRRALSS